jgi:N-methylhydantoinase B
MTSMQAPRKEAADRGLRLDPVTFEVLRNSLMTIADEMGLKLFRASFSPPVNQGRDYSIAIFDHDGELVTAGHWDMPIHYGTFQYTIREIRRVIGDENVKQGDIYLFNDPYSGGTHNQDIRAVRPIFRDGERIAWLVAMAHWADVGGPVPGSFNPEASDSFGEGLRITPIRIYEADEANEPLIEFVLANVRVHDERRGDLHAQVQTLYAGEERLLALADKYGLETMQTAFQDIWDYSERTLRAATEQLPDGEYVWEDAIDQDTVHPDKPPVWIRLKLTVDHGKLLFDFTDSDPAPMGPVGASLPSTWSGVLLTTLNLFPGVPFNAGSRRVLEVLTKPGTVTHVLAPKPVSGMACGALEKIISCTINVIGQASPERQAGCPGNLVNITMGGRDDRFDRDYIMYIWSPVGWGGTARGDKRIPTNIIFGPGVRIQPAEILERFYPVRITELSLRSGSAGAGQHQGSCGTTLGWEITDGTALMGIMGDHKDQPIWGVAGGQAGAGQDLVKNLGAADETSIGMFASNVPARAGDNFVCWTGGGGGWGNPLEREPELVLEDVIDELLSIDEARERYGVVIEAVDPYALQYELREGATVEERSRRLSRA